MDKPDVNKLVTDFLFLGMPVSGADQDSPDMNALIDAVRIILDNSMAEIRAAVKVYRSTEDLDTLFLTLLPIHSRIRYGAYAPYWLHHCRTVEDQDNEAEFTYYNDLIDMYWAWKWQEWKKKGEYAVTIMLPPTKGLIALAYRAELESYGIMNPNE